MTQDCVVNTYNSFPMESLPCWKRMATLELDAKALLNGDRKDRH